MIPSSRLSPAPGIYQTSRLVSLASAMPGAVIRFTTDGTDPTPSTGEIYSQPIAITSSTTLKAAAFGPGGAASAVASAFYQIEPNLIAVDAGFESPFVQRGMDHLPGNWRRFPIDGITRSTIGPSPGVVRSGSGALQIQVTRLMNGDPRVSIPVPGGLTAGRDYEAAVWIKSAKREARATLCVHNATDWFPTSFASTEREVGQDWTRLVLRFRSSQTAATAWMGIHLAEENTLWLDDASFRILDVADRDPAPPPGNLVRNASFETGTAGWKAAGVSFTSEIDATAPHGGRSARINWFGSTSNVLQSQGMELAWGRAYTLSLHARTSASGRAVRLSIQSGSSTVASRTFTTSGTGWENLSMTFSPPPVVDGTCFLVIDPPDAGTLWIDAVMLEASDMPSAFIPFAPVESELVIHHPGRKNAWFLPDEDVTGTLVLHHSGGSTIDLGLRRRVRDVWDRIVPGTTLEWVQPLPPGRTEIPLTLKTGDSRTGAFRAECDVADDITPPYAEALFSVFPVVSPAGTSPIGTTLDYQPDGPAGYRAAGAGWTKTWWLNWSNAQPGASSPFAFTSQQDGLINNWNAAGLKPLGILSNAPAWAQQFTPPYGWSNPVDFQKQSDYAAAAVQRYGAQVPVWELQNEPNQSVHASSGDTRATAYAREAVALANGAWSADPAARLLLGSLTIRDEFRPFINQIFNAQPSLKALDPATGRPKLHGVSFHFYTADPTVIRRTVGDIRAALADQGLVGLEIWDTEWSPILDSRSMKRAEFRGITRHSPSARRAAALVAQGFLSRLGEGVTTSVLYDTYNPGNMGVTGHKVMLELDGSFRPTAAAQAVLSAAVTGAIRHEAAEVPRAWCYRSTLADGRPLTILWSDDHQPVGQWIPYQTPEAVTARDFMGNPAGSHAAGDVIGIGQEPVYLLGDLGALSGLTATGMEQGVSLRWDPWPGASSYKVSYGTDGVSFPNRIRGLASPHTRLSGMNDGATVFFLVTAVDAGGTPLAHSIQVSATTGPPSGVLREYWTGISGTGIAALTGNPAYPASPTGSDVLPSLRASDWAGAGLSNWADQYGQRFRAWLVAPETGDYTFWTSGDDSNELWLSTDATPENRIRIAFNTNFTNQDEWNKSSTQRSSNNTFSFGGGPSGKIVLQAGSRYFLEVLHKENTGSDHLSVGWRRPSDGLGTTPAAIVSSLIPWSPPPDPPPAAPTGFSAAGGDRQVSLQWNAVAGATGYSILRSSAPGQPFIEIVGLPAASTSFIDTGLDPGTTHRYVLSAWIGETESAPSFELPATTFTLIEAWRNLHWGIPESTGTAADLADPDRDGLPNLIEYASGSVPTSPGTSPLLASLEGGRLKVSFQRIGDPALTYTVEGSTDLLEWEPVWTSSGASNVAGPVLVLDVETTTSQPMRMLRLRVEGQ